MTAHSIPSVEAKLRDQYNNKGTGQQSVNNGNGPQYNAGVINNYSSEPNSISPSASHTLSRLQYYCKMLLPREITRMMTLTQPVYGSLTRRY